MGDEQIKENPIWNFLQELSQKKGITEIVINSPKMVFVEREGQFIQLNINFTKNDIYSFVKDLADYNKKKCDEQNPILDGNLPDGSRVNVVLEPFAHGSPSITIRKYLRTLRRLDTSAQMFGLSPRWVEFFKAMVISKSNIIVAGGTGAGKTTLLNLLLAEIPMTERIVTIEDTLEIEMFQPNVVRLEAKSVYIDGNKSALTIRDLVKNSLRMRPDRIIIGEVRGPELFDLLQAMNTGHDGSMCSIHANSPAECVTRMESLFMMTGLEIPIGVVRKQLSTAVNFLIQIGRDRNGQRRVVQVAEITGMEGTSIQLQWIGKFEEGELQFTKITPKISQRLNEKGGLPLDFFNI